MKTILSLLLKTMPRIIAVIIIILSSVELSAQLSPGELSASHSSLEGISNCTQCHVLGNKQTNEKCLSCHSEINKRIADGKGYHSSSDVRGKECFKCHSEHNGREFKLIRLDVQKFDHKLTGYDLSVPHSKKDCRDCHNSKNVREDRLKNRRDTYLGLRSECLSCHTDYHIGTLSPECLSCHNPDTFVPATRFNHDNANFKLAGKHRSVECAKCHKVTITDNRKYQQFTGIRYVNCASCHSDPHRNQFGQNCRQCHSEESFQIVQGIKKFDHNRTGYKLEGKHMIVNCKSCHKGKFTDPLKHGRCIDCHADYHKGQFVKNGVLPDCSRCHNVNGFKQFTFTVSQHNEGAFALKGAHMAIPCYECHKKQANWAFRNIGKDCRDCHQDVHKGLISEKYYPDQNCTICHKVDSWSEVGFDHSKTEFALTGAHLSATCRSCHFRSYLNGTASQSFAGLSVSCSECHTDNHRNQFAENGVTDCMKCHDSKDWKAGKFDHNKTAFRLDGKHVNVACSKCHKPQVEGTSSFVLYKIKDFRCESCHF